MPRRPPPPVPAGVNAPQPGGRTVQPKAAGPGRPPPAPPLRPPPAVPAGVNAPQPGGRSVQAKPAAAPPATAQRRAAAPPVPAGVNAPQALGRVVQPAAAAARGATGGALRLPCPCGGAHRHPAHGGTVQAMFKQSTVDSMDMDTEETGMTSWAQQNYDFTYSPERSQMTLRNPRYGTNSSSQQEMLQNAIAAVKHMYSLISNNTQVYLQGDAKPGGSVLDKVTYHIAKTEGRSAGFNCYATTYESGQDVIVITSNTQKLNDKLQQFMDYVEQQTGAQVVFSSECHMGIHAEIQQLINTDNFEQSSLGIQKLCCFFCAALLLAAGVGILGSHGKTYGGYRIPKGILTLPKLRARLFGTAVADYYIGLTQQAQDQFLGFVVGVGDQSDLKGSARSMPKLGGVRSMTNTSVTNEFKDEYM